MFPQPRKWPGVLAGIVVVIVLYQNPTGAAHLVNHTVTAITCFASALNVGL
ncbi:hypothetical protein [Actinoallomurus sp. CA-142502]|uniref:hypothetical protein n=1 Tax=Actinoallomurus sp. CA-142502 TaxID=3239885 RepID=UPI003D917587